MKKLLRGSSVRLTALTEADLPAVVTWYQDTDFLRMFDAVPAYPKSEDQLIQWLKTQSASNTDFIFAIRKCQDDLLIGFIALDGILWNHGVAGVSIAIGDGADRGQGYGKEAMALMLDFAFLELNLHRIQLTVFEYNPSAIALYEKLGFKKEGVYREFLARDGKRFDMYLYGLLKPEWVKV
ncbi:GNAT family N-acetyltransferase [Camelliibacillus cellulosilyticus]|uniref:GNAT family N-acetyltransferase n=1 Tax=Camelliibacillus cellulosilyticus TaxID=2174486 RepID=A0ABV9GJK0_9BACL